ncbi:hypothetical protein ACWGDE_09175 [Streptomyces sp. NPDC054956]
MSASRAPAPPFVHIVVRRLLLPVWNALVAYGSLWLPADQYRLQYIRGGAVPPPPWQESVPVGGADGIHPDLETLRAS